MNKKIPDKMGVTIEVFSEGKIGLIVPLIRGMHGYETLEIADTKHDRWIEYINTNIRNDLNAQLLSERFGYSETIFRSIFYTRYGMSPSEYILKRRLILCAEEIEKGLMNPESICRKYRLKSVKKARELFLQHFDTTIEKVDDVQLVMISLPEYYEENKYRFAIRYETIDDFRISAQPTLKGTEDERHHLPSLTSYWFQNYADILPADSRIVALWEQIPSSRSKKKKYDYFIGPVIGNDVRPDREMFTFDIPGGKYAVFTLDTPEPDSHLAEQYSMMERCVFHSWVKENRLFYDETRLTFVMYQNEQLYFYVPTRA